MTADERLEAAAKAVSRIEREQYAEGWCEQANPEDVARAAILAYCKGAAEVFIAEGCGSYHTETHYVVGCKLCVQHDNGVESCPLSDCPGPGTYLLLPKPEEK